MAAPAGGADPGLVARGAYLANAADCVACHTDDKHGGKPFAGGVALPTPFGTFYSPNITPDRETGIGSWSDGDFRRALRWGVRPDGANFFPAFPYPSFTLIADDDVRAIKAYLFSLGPVRHANRPHDIAFPLSWRPLQTIWKWLYFTPGPFHPNPGRDAEYNRGAYLVRALAHCGECHTPRNFLGAMEEGRFLVGNPSGPDGKRVPNITPDHKTGIGDWTLDDIVGVLKDGRLPTGDEVGGAMQEVVRSTAKLSDADRHAIAVYLKSVPPVSTAEPK
ncbi:MAG TPA: cytochrome c [Stellaceae bacterium]|nr:cytochrome c [Stellaceae bacterium]